MHRIPRPCRIILKATAIIFLLFQLCFGEGAKAPSISPVQLVRHTIDNEVSASRGPDNYFFRDDVRKPHGGQTKLMVETRDGMAGLVVRIDGHPLTPEQKTSEQARVHRFINNPDELKKKQKQEAENTERSNRILKALPDAFLYEYDGSTMGTAELGQAGRPLVRLKFKPNPNYSPPSRVEQVLTGMAGHLLIDPLQFRLAEIDGTLIQEVSFGWGIFGHLDKGGRFVVRQADVDNGHWELTRMELSFSGKILLFKSLAIKSEEIESDFQRVPPDLTFAQGVQLLE
ncbi:MAG TPA: hypothetical protein VGG46_00130, partial [Terriglobales bacterium]